MGLGWLVPAFLAGLVAVVVPVLVHLRQREKREPVRFPSLMFLRRVPHRTVERRRLTHPWLLLLRALAVVALVGAFARPFLRREDERPAGVRASRALIVVVDRSMSMGYQGVWDRAMDSARSIVAAAGPGDRVAVVAFDETAEIVAPLDEAGPAGAALAALRPSGRGSRLAPAIRTARELAAQARGLAVEIAVVSDLQRHALVGLEAVERIPGAAMRFVAVGEPNPVNARLVEVEVDRRPEGGRTRLAVSARIASKGGDARGTTATLLVNGRPLGTTAVRLGANAVVTARFDPVYIAEGDAQAVVALAPDALVADDTLRFSLSNASGVPVVLVVPPGAAGDETLFLERALAISRAPVLAVGIKRSATLTAFDLERARAVVIADVGALAGGAIGPLGDFVERGGGLVLLTGPRGVGPSASWWPARVGVPVDRMDERGGRLGQMDADHPVFEPFKEALASDFGAARFFRYRILTPDSTAQVLARFDDGQPAMIETRHGRGRVVMLGTSGNSLWTDFPLQPVFLPLMQRLVGYTGQIQDEKRWYGVGDVATLPEATGAVTVKPPAGLERRITGDSGARALPLDMPGVYEVRSDLATAPVGRFAVNTAAAESDLAAAPAAEVILQLREPPDSADAPNVAPLTAVEQERGQSWWIGLLVLALGLLVAENVYAGRLQRRAGLAGGAS